jgi:signal transduction histidine kinase
VAKRALAPLNRLAKTAGTIATTGELGQRLPAAEKGDEVGNLTVSFNGMLDRIEQQQIQLSASLENQRRFVADASHELRNPLATIRGNLSFLASHPDAARSDQTSAVNDSNRAATRMSDLIDDLLRLARLDSDLAPTMEIVSIREVIDEAVNRAVEPPSTIKVEDARVKANFDDLARLVTNLLDNSARHGAPPTELEAAVRGAEIEMTVSDRGPGIAADQLEAVFGRFRRLDPARSADGGSGLGLAIARAIAERAGGSLEAANRAGGGATLTLKLPLA